MKRGMMFFVLCLLFAGVGVVYGESIKLVWDANVESDLAGYKIYSSATTGGPYVLLQDVGNVTELPLDLTGKPDGEIFYVATAYDLKKNESGYSNQASYVVDHTAPAAPSGCTVVEIK